MLIWAFELSWNFFTPHKLQSVAEHKILNGRSSGDDGIRITPIQSIENCLEFEHDPECYLYRSHLPCCTAQCSSKHPNSSWVWAKEKQIKKKWEMNEKQTHCNWYASPSNQLIARKLVRTHACNAHAKSNDNDNQQMVIENTHTHTSLTYLSSHNEEKRKCLKLGNLYNYLI